ncbi:MAG: RNA-binding protein [Lactobacillales bacterium]|jgi:RNA-binding protein YlmH|nr:RNA-binding protein [Lactobacillales bacterium]
MDANVYQHFRKDEHPFIDAVGEWIERVDSQYAPYLSEFLDPRQQFILETLVRQNSELSFQFYGGYEAAERKRALIFPSYFEPTQEDFQISIYEIVYPVKFATLGHGKILGSLLSVGIRRDYFGDIISNGERWQIFLAKETANFVTSQVEKIGKISVRLEERKYMEIIVPKDEWSIENSTVSSLRLDNLISNVYNISRQRSKQLIEASKVKVNWTEETRTDFQVDLLDVVSVRGYGRIQLREIEGKTKKDKIKTTLGVLRK